MRQLYSPIEIAADASDRLEPAFFCTAELLLSSLFRLQCSRRGIEQNPYWFDQGLISIATATASRSSPCQPMKMLRQIVASKSSCSLAEKHGLGDQTSAVHLLTHYTLLPFSAILGSRFVVWLHRTTISHTQVT